MNELLYLFRLIPPRADFAQTMTPAEQHAMQQHQEYWRELLTQGRVVIYGDPSVVAGVNTFEVFEIMGGITG
jgi:hypothetical protein